MIASGIDSFGYREAFASHLRPNWHFGYPILGSEDGDERETLFGKFSKNLYEHGSSRGANPFPRNDFPAVC